MAWKVKVTATPVPEGNLKCIGARGGRGHTVIHSNDKTLRPWRTLVALSCKGIAAKGVHYDGPVDVDVTFYLPRPKSVSVTARPLPTVKPDVDKLVRGVLDGITDSGLWNDDAQVTDLTTRKRYADEANPPGAVIILDTGGL